MDLSETIERLRSGKEKLERVISFLEELPTTGSVAGLHREKERMEQVIASLEELRATMSVPAKGRRGRKSVSLEERRELSIRMKKYWEERNNQRRPWS